MRYRSFVYDSARWERYPHRAGDVVISTPPKCGTTWMQNIVGMLLHGTATFDRPIAELSPWLDQLVRPIDDVVADLEAMAHRRFIKTHTPLDGLPWHDDVTYVCVLRDPRDAAVSWDHHFANMDLERLVALRAEAHGLHDLAELPPTPEPSDDPVERWWRYVTARAAEPQFAAHLELVVRHLDTAWERRLEPNVVLVHYADLVADLDGEMRRIAERLDAEVDDARWPALVEAAGFDAMRARADALVPNAGLIWRDDQAFFHRGGSGQWQELVGEAAMPRYWDAVADLLPDAERSSWLHRP